MQAGENPGRAPGTGQQRLGVNDPLVDDTLLVPHSDPVPVSAGLRVPGVVNVLGVSGSMPID